MVTVRHKGDFSKLTRYFKHASSAASRCDFDKYGREGVRALESATPVETGLTAKSWYYEIERKNGSVSIVFYNSNVQNGVPIAIILQYGHATRNGSWVQGVDYINPALQPVFDKIAKDAWEEVTKL